MTRAGLVTAATGTVGGHVRAALADRGASAKIGSRDPDAASEQSCDAGGPVRVVNPLLKRLLRSPLHGLVSDDLPSVNVTGRQRGTEYTFPVGYERFDDTVSVTSHGTNW